MQVFGRFLLTELRQLETRVTVTIIWLILVNHLPMFIEHIRMLRMHMLLRYTN